MDPSRRAPPRCVALAGALALAAAAPTAAAFAEDDLARWVDPFIGTGGHGHTFPGPTLPFGMVQVGPDTRLEGWDGCSGYHFTDTVVYGFSHTHLSGTGISDYGDVLLMPTSGPVLWDNGYVGGPDTGYASRFDKRGERAEAGYYAVRLADTDIDVELTATERVGFHRYRFPAGDEARVVVDLVHRDEVIDSTLRVVGDREVEGFRRSTGWARDQVVYFVARFSRPFAAATLAVRDTPVEGAASVSGTHVKGMLAFGDAGGELLVRVGISAVDVEGARRNLDAEIPGQDFDAVRAAARDAWNVALSRVEVEGGTEAERTIFYTALYHSMIAPNLFSDVDGRYRGMDRAIHRAEGRRHYTVFSLWDTYRATHPLLALIEPRRTREFIETMLAMYREGGRLPVWELAGNETDTMIGYHSVSVIADAWMRGIRDFDGGLALEAMLDSAGRDAFGLDAYRRQGFVGSEDDHESVSKTLEYAYDDWCIARMAEAQGEEATAREFDRRSQGWRHLYDPATGFMRARRNQRWVEPFDPRRVDQHYTEANAWQYGLYVPHDVRGLTAMLGGDAALVRRLDAMFAADSATTGREQADITGLIGQYAHGNEPSHHMAWLYHYAGRPDLSARRVAEILGGLYGATPDGLSGNEDCGQMSSWYVLSAIGLYSVSPGAGDWLIGNPLFSRVTVRPDGGKPFTIRAGGEGTLVAGVALDGRRHDRSWIGHLELTGAGELAVTRAEEPGNVWGIAPESRPRSEVGGERVPAAPFVVGGSDRFREPVEVEIASADPDAVLRYAFEPWAGDGTLQTYAGPLRVEDTARVALRADRAGVESPVVVAGFHRIPSDRTVQLVHEPATQYAADGPDTLIDGLRAPENWRIGGWLGFQQTDLIAIVDLGAPRPIHRAGASFLQDVEAWIWMPREVVVAVSTDGAAFHEVARLVSGVPDTGYSKVIREVAADLDGIDARYVRIEARTYGTIPDWHLGRGGQSWIFVDEIVVE